jgi:hypothetical protein
MTIWYTAPQNIAAGGTQHEIRHLVREVVRADGKFPYRPGIVSGLYLHLSGGDQALAPAFGSCVWLMRCLVPYQACPKPLRKYEAQIGLKIMEDQVDEVAPVPHNTLAKWTLEALATRAQSHFAHLRDPVAIMNCNLCITSSAGRLVIDWVLAVTSTNPTAPYPIDRSAPTPTFRASGCPGNSPGEITTKVNPGSLQEFMGPNPTKSASNATTWSNLRSEMVGTMLRGNACPLIDYRKQMCHDKRSTLRASEPLLPDRDGITTKAWGQSYQSSLQSFLEDEEDEQILWPRGVCAYSHPFGRPLAISNRALPL